MGRYDDGSDYTNVTIRARVNQTYGMQTTLMRHEKWFESQSAQGFFFLSSFVFSFCFSFNFLLFSHVLIPGEGGEGVEY